jgi:hypothetical protein
MPFQMVGFSFPLPRAEHRGQGRRKCVGLSERSEFRHAPPLALTRRRKRGRGVFFWFVFFHVEENEQTKKNLTPDQSNLAGSSPRGEEFKSRLKLANTHGLIPRTVHFHR